MREAPESLHPAPSHRPACRHSQYWVGCQGAGLSSSSASDLATLRRPLEDTSPCSAGTASTPPSSALLRVRGTWWRGGRAAGLRGACRPQQRTAGSAASPSVPAAPALPDLGIRGVELGAPQQRGGARGQRRGLRVHSRAAGSAGEPIASQGGASRHDMSGQSLFLGATRAVAGDCATLGHPAAHWLLCALHYRSPHHAGARHQGIAGVGVVAGRHDVDAGRGDVHLCWVAEGVQGRGGGRAAFAGRRRPRACKSGVRPRPEGPLATARSSRTVAHGACPPPAQPPLAQPPTLVGE